MKWNPVIAAPPGKTVGRSTSDAAPGSNPAYERPDSEKSQQAKTNERCDENDER